MSKHLPSRMRPQNEWGQQRGIYKDELIAALAGMPDETLLIPNMVGNLIVASLEQDGTEIVCVYQGFVSMSDQEYHDANGRKGEQVRW